jgi:hypothetical protein
MNTFEAYNLLGMKVKYLFYKNNIQTFFIERL